jgi:hypothetical protein
MIKVYRIPISKDQFRQLPKEERSIVLVSGHILNQISVFMKLVRFSTNKDPVNPIEDNVSGMQSQLILRCLIGVLAEACVWLEERQPLIETYLVTMNPEGRGAYGKMKLNFDKKALLRLIRHNYLYHYPNDKNVERAFEAIPADDPWEWYFSEASTNSFYFSCELILGYGLVRATGEPTPIAAFSMVMAKAMELADTMPDFLMRLIEVIMVKYLGTDIFAPQPGATIADAPALGEFWIPFFAATDR